ncbi:hypothetical protein [Streptomyces sp. NPDC058657]|uniref:hypothetical protein n=1 Tax=unclassified Streptomyces TaxID=2593676 RepID=UPI0036514488
MDEMTVDELLADGDGAHERVPLVTEAEARAVLLLLGHLDEEVHPMVGELRMRLARRLPAP